MKDKNQRSDVDARKIMSAWKLVKEAAQKGAFAGAVGLAAYRGKIVLHESCGFASIVPKKTPMHQNSIFDLASITKAVATTTSALILLERRKISLDDNISSLIPDFFSKQDDEQSWRRAVNVRHLLSHTSGLPAWSDLYVRHRSRRSLLLEVCKKFSPESEPGSTFNYSDLGYILLGLIVEEISRNRLDSFAQKNIFDPLKMKDTCFNPPLSMASRIVSTEFSNWRGGFIKGEVHDENACAMEGVGGHAGLFSTAADLAIFCQCLLDDISGRGTKLLSRSTLKMISDDSTQKLGAYAGLGWWILSKSTPNTSRNFSKRSFGHNGYTGTSLWIDPERELFIILLTNRIHPVREGDPAQDKSVGIMMKRKNAWGEINRAFQDAVISSIT